MDASWDDLTRLKGINRDRAISISESMLRYEGLNPDSDSFSFAMMSQCHPADLAEPLNTEEANLNHELIKSWPQQAKLAAEGQWLELSTLQATLPEWES